MDWIIILLKTRGQNGNFPQHTFIPNFSQSPQDFYFWRVYIIHVHVNVYLRIPHFYIQHRKHVNKICHGQSLECSSNLSRLGLTDILLKVDQMSVKGWSNLGQNLAPGYSMWQIIYQDLTNVMVKSSPKSALSNDQVLSKIRPSFLGQGSEWNNSNFLKHTLDYITLANESLTWDI